MTVLRQRFYEPHQQPEKKRKKAAARTHRAHGYVYRVGWQRRDRETGKKLRPKYKHFHTRDAAERFWRLFGPAPWRYFRNPMEPGDRWPCHDCERGFREVKRTEYLTERVPCEKCYGGATVRDFIFRRRLELPEIIWIRLERRPVGAWEGVDVQWEDEVPAEAGVVSIRPESTAARFLAEALSSLEE